MELFDTHCHLLLGALERQSEAAWMRARAAGVGQAVLVGIDEPTSRAAVRFATGREGLFPSAGLHPNETHKVPDAPLGWLEDLARSGQVVALGETGLDLYWKDAPIDIQLRHLERHCELALETGLPLILHIRDAFPHAAAALRDFAASGGRGVLHCFTGGPADLERFTGYGFYVSLSGVITYKSADDLRSAAKLVPEDLLLIETDAPWLPPVPRRGETNEPAFLVHTAIALAKLRQAPIEQIAATTTANARRLFGIGPGGSIA